MSDDNLNELTQEQLRGLPLALYEQTITEDFDRPQLFTLVADEIIDELEESSPSELKGKLKKFSWDTLKYDGGGRWTQPKAINRIFLSELKRQQVDATQPIQAL